MSTSSSSHLATQVPALELNRRSALALLASPWATPLWPAAGLAATALSAGQAAQAAVRTDLITVLYRPADPQAPTRLDPAVQASIQALETEFLRAGLRVMQPSAEVYRVMDQGQSVVVTFADDAGYSLVFSAYRDLREVPREDGGVCEVRLEGRVFVGRHIISSEESVGRMFTRLDAGNRDYGVRRAMELAARRAAAELSEKISGRLKSISPTELNQQVGSAPSNAMVVTPLALPTEPLPNGVDAGSAPMAPPPLPNAPLTPTAPAVAPAPQPVPAPQPAPAPAAPLPAPAKRWALVVGMSDHSSLRARGLDISDLPGVARDMGLVHQMLRELDFDAQNIAVLRDAQATSSAVRGHMKRLAAQVGPDDILVLFISSHGGNKDFSASGFGMPVLADFAPRNPDNLDFWELQSMARNLRGRVVWLNDTCHSGGAATNIATVQVSARGVQAGIGLRGPDALTVAQAAPPAMAGQDFAILTASSPQEISLDTSEGGLFTKTLVRAVRETRGRLPLGQMFAERVHAPVVDASRRICKGGSGCHGHPQQTPVMAVGGRGYQIVL